MLNKRLFLRKKAKPFKSFLWNFKLEFKSQVFVLVTLVNIQIKFQIKVHWITQQLQDETLKDDIKLMKFDDLKFKLILMAY